MIKASHYTRRIAVKISKRHLNSHVHSSTIHSSQEVETTSMCPMGNYTHTGNGVCAYDGALFSRQKGNSAERNRATNSHTVLVEV